MGAAVFITIHWRFKYVFTFLTEMLSLGFFTQRLQIFCVNMEFDLVTWIVRPRCNGVHVKGNYVVTWSSFSAFRIPECGMNKNYWNLRIQFPYAQYNSWHLTGWWEGKTAEAVNGGLAAECVCVCARVVGVGINSTLDVCIHGVSIKRMNGRSIWTCVELGFLFK